MASLEGEFAKMIARDYFQVAEAVVVDVRLSWSYRLVEWMMPPREKSLYVMTATRTSNVVEKVTIGQLIFTAAAFVCVT